jgi:hypothetical protein
MTYILFLLLISALMLISYQYIANIIDSLTANISNLTLRKNVNTLSKILVKISIGVTVLLTIFLAAIFAASREKKK